MSSTPWRPWLWSITCLLGWLLLCAVIGTELGSLWIGLTAGLAIAHTAHCWQLYQLHSQLRHRRSFHRPKGLGVLADMQMRLYQRQREARQRKRRLHTLLRTFRSAAASLPDAILVVSKSDLKIDWFNEASVRFLGLRPRADVGRKFTDVVSGPRVVDWLASGALEPLSDIPAPTDPARRLSLRLIDYTDQYRLLVVRDVSKLMHLEQVRRDFVANVSHELRTPLTVVHGYLDMLEPDEHPAWASLLREMRTQSARMTQVVEDLLTLSRLEAQERAIEDPVDMRSQLSKLKREAEALSNGRHRITVTESCELDLHGSSQELHSAFSNLVSNAVRYTPDGGHIEISYACDDQGRPRLAVKDSGNGIPAVHLPRITERFYRVSNSRSRESGGTGLGLSIVKHVLNLHQGHLDIHSEVGKGSEFACVFAASRGIVRDSDGDEAA